MARSHTAPEELSPAALLELYNCTCAMCFGKAVTIHEIEPKSKRSADWWEFDNRVPLCGYCHDLVHLEGTARWHDRLHEARAVLVSLYGIEVTVTLPHT